MINSALFSSTSEEWSTPQSLFDKLNEEFKFIFDIAASNENTKCKLYWTKDDDALNQIWDFHTQAAWLNPPYGRNMYQWVAKAYYDTMQFGSTIVMLLPARTDTKWFHHFIYAPLGDVHRPEVRFIKGRLKFGDSKNSAPFPSMVVIFR